MSPERKKRIGNKLVEEYYWAGKMVVYIDHCSTKETFEQACERLDNKAVESDRATDGHCLSVGPYENNDTFFGGFLITKPPGSSP